MSRYERMNIFFNAGITKNLSENELAWNNHKLIIEEAPEPNDVDWEFIHVTTGEKIKWRIISYSLSFLFMFVVFMIIYLIAHFQSNLIDKAYENI